MLFSREGYWNMFEGAGSIPDHGDNSFHLSGHVVIDYKLTPYFIFFHTAMKSTLSDRSGVNIIILLKYWKRREKYWNLNELKGNKLIGEVTILETELKCLLTNIWKSALEDELNGNMEPHSSLSKIEFSFGVEIEKIIIIIIQTQYKLTILLKIFIDVYQRKWWFT